MHYTYIPIEGKPKAAIRFMQNSSEKTNYYETYFGRNPEYMDLNESN